MYGTQAMQSYMKDPFRDSISVNQLHPSQLNDLVSKIASMVPDGCGILIVPHDFELTLEQASIFMNTTYELLELMLVDSNIISANRTVSANDILRFRSQRADAKKKSFEKIAKSKAHLFGVD